MEQYKMKELHSNYFFNQVIQLHYYQMGSGPIPIILLHGITDDGLCWMPVANALAPEYSLYMLDMRGHGKSDAPDGGYTLENMALDLAAFIRAMRLVKPVLLGHSMGALVSLLFAGFYPELPRAIILEDPPPFWRPGFPTAEDAESLAGLREWMVGLKRKTSQEIIAEGRASNPRWSDEEFGPWADAKQRFGMAITQLLYPPDQGSIDYPKITRRITCPATLFSAETKWGAVSSKDDIALLKEWMPQLNVIHFEESGHSIRRDQFSQYINAVQIILQGLHTG
jgi:N-formylmaleamate deformylase